MNLLTREQVIRVLGPDAVDDHTIMAILDTHASEGELCEAYNLFVRGGDLDSERQHPVPARINLICDILADLEAASDESDLGRPLDGAVTP